MTRIFVSLALFAVALGIALHPALAQTVTSTATVDFTPTITLIFNDYVLPILGTVVAALVGWLALLLKNKTGIDIAAGYQKQIDDFVTQQAGGILAKVVSVQHFDISVNNPMIAAASNEALMHVGDALTYLGVTPLNVEAFISKLIVKKLGVLTANEPDVAPPANASVAGTVVVVPGAAA